MGKFQPNHYLCVMYNRFISRSIAEALQDTPALLITGARQTGKSTLCRQLTESGLFAGRSVTLDDPATLSAAISDPMGFLESLGKHVIIDEIQRAPGLFLGLKKLIDEDREGRRVIMTGSADVMALPKVADSLAGRIEIHHLWPLSQDELLGRPSSFLNTLISQDASFVYNKTKWPDIVSKIKTGGYPEAIRRETDNRKARWFESYIVSILQKDIRELANIEGLTQLPNILKLISTRVGSTINLSDIARISGIKNTTFQRYMALLEHVFLILSIPAWTPNAEGRFVKSPKLFLNDTGLLCHLRDQDDGLIENRTLAGSFLENFVVMEIIKQLSWSEKLLKPYHFSVHSGAEVDLVLEDRKGDLYGIEIKATSAIQENDFRGLKRLAEYNDERLKKGIVLYTGDQILGGFGGKNFYAVPISAVWG